MANGSSRWGTPNSSAGAVVIPSGRGPSRPHPDSRPVCFDRSAPRCSSSRREANCSAPNGPRRLHPTSPSPCSSGTPCPQPGRSPPPETASRSEPVPVPSNRFHCRLRCLQRTQPRLEPRAAANAAAAGRPRGAGRSGAGRFARWSTVPKGGISSWSAAAEQPRSSASPPANPSPHRPNDPRTFK